jgi:hypothetical protein
MAGLLSIHVAGDWIGFVAWSGAPEGERTDAAGHAAASDPQILSESSGWGEPLPAATAGVPATPSSPTPLLEEIVAQVNADMHAGVQEYEAGALSPLGSEPDQRIPVWTRQGDDWVIEPSEVDGPVIGVSGGNPFSATRAQAELARERSLSKGSDAVLGASSNAFGDGEPKVPGGEVLTIIGDKTCNLDTSCTTPPPPATLLPNPNQCQIDKTVHPTHPNCNPDTITHPICGIPTIVPPICMPTMIGPGCTPTTTGVCRYGPYTGGFGDDFGFDYILDSAYECCWIVGWPTMPEGAQQDFFATVSPLGGTFTWSVVQPGNQVTLTNVTSPAVRVTAVNKSQNFRDVKLRVTYKYTHPNWGPRILVDEFPITVFKYDIQVRKPMVIDPAEAVVPEADETNKGTQTWVNLDNDDSDVDNDLNDPSVDPQDDELIKVTLRVQPSDMRLGGLALTTAGNTTAVKAWKDAKKSQEHKIGGWWLGGDVYWMDPTNAFGFYQVNDADGAWWAHDVWVESVEPSDAQKDVELAIEYDGLVILPVCHLNIPQLFGQWPDPDKAVATFLSPHSLEWIGKSNGFAPPGHGSNVLDADVLNATITLGDGNDVDNVRVFPDARIANTSVPVNHVDLEVELAVAPVEDVQIFVKALDFDDPETDTTEIDPNDTGGGGTYNGSALTYTEHDDNRGDVGGRKSGALAGQDAAGIAPLQFTANNKSAKVDFTTTLQPGDNFICVVNGDRDYLGAIENKDHDDDFGVVDSHIRGSGNDENVVQDPPESRYVSDVLTVYRVLHVERDSMVAVPAPPAVNHNRLITTLSQLRTGTTEAVTTGALNAGDPSKNLGPPDNGDGRFQQGRLTLGTGGAAIVVNPVVGNGPSYVRNGAAMVIPFVLTKPGQANVSGNVSALAANVFTLTVTAGTLKVEHNGGTLTVAGFAMAVTAVNVPASQVTVGNSAIPVEVRDDDDETALPHDADFDEMIGCYDNAYYHPQVDGGGAAANNQNNIPFLANLNTPDILTSMRYDTAAGVETDHFWVVYLGTSYQDSNDSDVDPDYAGGAPRGEWGNGGVANGAGQSNLAVTIGGVTSWLHEETCRDRIDDPPGGPFGPATPRLRGLVVAHEIGHQLGFAHDGEGGTIMGPVHSVPANVGFSNRLLNLMRCRVRGPGIP